MAQDELVQLGIPTPPILTPIESNHLEVHLMEAVDLVGMNVDQKKKLFWKLNGSRFN